MFVFEADSGGRSTSKATPVAEPQCAGVVMSAGIMLAHGPELGAVHPSVHCQERGGRAAPAT